MDIMWGEKIKKYRLMRAKSQLDLELEAGMSPGSISRLENNKINPTKETLVKIAKILQLSKEEVMDLFCINEVIEFI